MARASFVAAVVAACFFMPLVVSGARTVGTTGSRFVVQGRVFCDTCRAGFETPATTYIEGNKNPSEAFCVFSFWTVRSGPGLDLDVPLAAVSRSC